MTYYITLLAILFIGITSAIAEETAPDQIDQSLLKVRTLLKSDIDSAYIWGKKTLHMAELTSDTIKLARCQSHMASIYRQKQDYDSALYYIQLCCENYKATKAFGKHYIQNHLKLGNLEQLTGRYQQASQTYIQLWPMCKTDHNLMVQVTGALMNTKLLSCEYDRAFYYSTKLEEQLKEMGNTKQAWHPWYAKAHIYFELKEYEKSIEYLNKLKCFADSTGSEPVTAIYHGIQSGIDMYYNYNYQQALYHLKISLAIWEKMKVDEQIGFTSIYVGFVYGKLKDRVKAEKYYAQAKRYLEPLGINNKIYELYRYKAETHYDWGEYKAAKIYANKALEMHKHFGLQMEILKVYDIISHVEQAEGNPSKALEYLQLHNNFKDSIFSMARINSVKYMEQEYIENEKQYKIDMLSLKNEQQDVMLAKQKQLNGVFAVVFVLLLVGGILAYAYIRQRKRLLEKEAQRRALQSELKGQEEERNRIAKDLHDGVVSDLTGLKYHLDALEITSPALNSAVKRISVISSDIRHISHNLATPLFMNANLEEVLVQFAEEVNNTNNLDVKTLFYPTIDWQVVPADFQIEVYRVIQEIVSNTLKHANATRLTMQIVMRHDSFHIGIEDNGMGFIIDAKKTGIGLQNITKRIEALGGEITIESTPNTPTTYIIEIPHIIAEQAMIS